MKKEEINFDWVNYGPKEIEEIKERVKENIEKEKKYFREIDLNNLNFSNVLGAFDKFSYDRHKEMGGFFAFVNLSKDENVRNTARKVEIELSSILSEFAYDMNIYKVFDTYYNKFFKKEKSKLTNEEVKIVEDTHKAYKQMGMHLSDKVKKELLKKKTELNKLCSDFEELCTKNFQKGLWFKEGELKGVPGNILKTFQTGDKGYFVRTLPTEATNVMKYCEVSKTRERLSKMLEESVGDVNTKRFVKILKLRSEITKILGFKTFSHIAMDDEMVHDPLKAKAFLEKVIKSVSKEYSKYLSKLNIYSAKDRVKLNTSNSSYYANIMRREEYDVDMEVYKPYFELENVMKVVFKIWEEIFGLKKEEVTVPAFHESQWSYKFYDSKTGELYGYAFFDLFPREGKYGHACVADFLKKTTVEVNGKKQRSVGATYLVCNFAKNKDGKTLISFNDVNTLFHECGHMLHDILMKNNYLASSHTSRDFVEIPSQFFENFLLDEKFVKENFKHYETGEEMPKELLKKITVVNKVGEAAIWTRVSATALADLAMHGKNILKYNNTKKIDSLFETTFKKFIKVPTKNKRHYLSGFAHMVGGYESRYCSYVISRVYAQDFWEEFAKGGIKKGKMAEKYKIFLEKANTEKEEKLVKEFLGRSSNAKAFLKYVSVR